MENSRRERIKSKIKAEIAKAYMHKRAIIAIISIIVLSTIYLSKGSSSITLRYSTFLGMVIGFYILDHLFDIRFNFKHYLFVIIMGVGGILMGPFYFIYPSFDKFQHFIFPMFLCSLILYMINKLRLEMKWKLTFTVLSVIALLGTFEIAEYVLDLLFNWKLQGVYLRDITGLEKFNLILDPLDDTMIDLTFGIFGSTSYALFAWIRHRILIKKKLAKTI